MRLFFWSSNFEDFWIFFQSRPIPGLYLKPFKSYSLSKSTTILSTWQIFNYWKKCLSFLYPMIRLAKSFWAFFRQSNFEDFWIFFHSRPIPSLYLKRFKSYSSSKWNTSYLEFFSLLELWKRFLTVFTLFFTTHKRLKIKNFFFLILKA